MKKDLYQYCSNMINNRIREIESRLEAIRESRDSETKSSAGDKYETGRAMMQIEEENCIRQLAEAKEVRKKLATVDISKTYSSAESGSLVSTNQGVYFLSIGLGKITLDDKIFFCISTDSPIGKLLRNKTAGDSVSFNQNVIEISAID